MVSIACVSRFLGVGKDRRVILSSMLLVIISFFYCFVVGSALETKIYTFQYRVTYHNLFLTHITTQNVDTFIALSAAVTWFYFSSKNTYIKATIMIFFSIFMLLALVNYVTLSVFGVGLTLPVIISLVFIDRCGDKKMLVYDVRLSIDYISIVTIFLTTLGILGLILFVINGGTTTTLEKYPYALYQQLLSVLTPAITAALVFCIPVKIILTGFINKMKNHTLLLNIVEVKLDNKRVAIYLLLCVIFGIGVVFISHLTVINPNNERLGVDTPRYVDWLNHMQNQTENQIYYLLKGDRPLTLMILFLVTEAVKADPFQVAEYSTLLLVPLLILVTFFLTRQLTANDKISIIASFLSAISFQTLIGIYSGFYANWLALVFGYLAFGLLFSYLKHPSKPIIAALAVAMTAVLLAHTPTWSIVICVAFVFLFVLHIYNYYPKKRFLLLYLVLSSSIAVDLLKSSWTGSSTGLEADISIGFGHGLGVSQFSERLGTLTDTVQTYYGGAYANIVILGLAMYWLVRCQPREPANIFLLIFMSTALIPLFIGDYVLQSRVLYEIPFQIPAAISLYNIGKKNGMMMFIALLLITVYLSFHVLTNLGYIPPSSGRVLIQR